jgi:hypothetical protein
LSRGQRIDLIANADWQQIVNNPGRNTLIAVDNDVGNYEILRVERACEAKG